MWGEETSGPRWRLGKEERETEVCSGEGMWSSLIGCQLVCLVGVGLHTERGEFESTKISDCHGSF
jgi:hypothetical protein